jgi:hypothetical protein
LETTGVEQYWERALEIVASLRHEGLNAEADLVNEAVTEPALEPN